MTAYETIYNPCQFSLEDGIIHPHLRGSASSGMVEILDDKTALPRNWTMVNEAPVGPGYGAGYPTSGAESQSGSRMLRLCAAWGAIVVAFGMSLL